MSTAPFPPRVPRSELIQSHIAIIRDILKAYTGYQARFGNLFKVRILKRFFLVATNAEYAAHVLVKNHRNYQKDRPSHIVGEVLGNGILFSEGDYWLRQRRLIQPGFHKKQIENLSRLMVQETQKIVAELEKVEGPIDTHEWMTRLALQVISRTLFSEGIDEKGFRTVDDSLTELLHFIIVRIRNPFLLRWYKLTGKLSFFDQKREELDGLIFNMVDARMAEGPGDTDLMDMLLTARDADTGEPLTREELRQELIGLFSAGHETSANGLTYTLELLAGHPEVLAKVEREIEQVVGEGELAFSQIMRLTYMRQVIDESLRLYPPAWMIGREALGPDEINGLKLEEGDSVSVFIYGLHRNPEYWNNPDQFDPERFNEANKKARKPYTYIPFGGGPRLCIGHQFAIIEMQIALALILKRFRISRANPEQPMELFPSVTLRPGSPVLLNLEAKETHN